MTQPDNQRGAALLSILVVVAALAVAALVATTAIARQTDLSKASFRRSDASWAAYSAEALALSAVDELTKSTAGQISPMMTGLGETVAIPIRGGVVSFEVTDATNCFNINALADKDENAATLARLSWATLLRDLDIPAADANGLANALADWLDADSNTRQGGAEDGYYMTLSPSYRAANQMMDSPYELAAVMGYTADLSAALEPVICTRRNTQVVRLNINTLSPKQASLLRAAYSEALTLAAAERILSERPETGWSSVDQFESLPDIRTIPEGQKRTEALSVNSGLYEARGRTVLDSGSWPFAFLISTENGAAAHTVWRRMGEE